MWDSDLHLITRSVKLKITLTLWDIDIHLSTRSVKLKIALTLWDSDLHLITRSVKLKITLTLWAGDLYLIKTLWTTEGDYFIHCEKEISISSKRSRQLKVITWDTVRGWSPSHQDALDNWRRLRQTLWDGDLHLIKTLWTTDREYLTQCKRTISSSSRRSGQPKEIPSDIARRRSPSYQDGSHK